MNRLLAIALVLVVTACTGDADGQGAAARNGKKGAGKEGGAGAGTAATTNGGGGAGGAGARAGAGGRGAGSISLNASDVAAVTRSTLEEAVPITGNLEPVERIMVRARIEGDLVGIYAREGQRVRTGEVLARFQSTNQDSDQKSAEADLVSAKTEMDNAQWNFEQTSELFKQGAVPQRDVKNAEQAVAASRAHVAATQAKLRSSSQTFSDTRVLAPADGVIEKRLTSDGEHLTRGQPLFTLVRTGVLELAAAVPARRANGLVPGQVAHFSAEGRQFTGKVARVSPTVDPASRSVTVYVQVPNASNALKGGTFATGRVVARVIKDALVVPTSAIRQRQESGETFAYRVADGVVDYATMKLGVIDEAQGFAQVLEGLSDGDRVVVGNVGLLGKGMKVQVLGAENRRRAASKQ